MKILITSESKSIVARVDKNKECIVQKNIPPENMEASQIFIFLMEKRKSNSKLKLKKNWQTRFFIPINEISFK